MAFLFGKKKSHGREGTPTSTTTSNTLVGTPPSNSLNNSMATLSSVEASPDSSKQATLSQTPPTSSQKPASSSQPPHSNNLLYPWSIRKLQLPRGQSPFPRYGHAANVTASKEGEIYIMGGLIQHQVRGDIWKIENPANGPGPVAIPVKSQSEGPGPRVGHASLLVGNAFIVFGGDTKFNDNDVLDERLYLLNTSTFLWSKVLPQSYTPCGRYGHTLTLNGSKLYVFGGQIDEHYFNDMVAFDLNTLQTTPKLELLVPSKDGPTDIPKARTNHTMVSWGDKLYLFGGTDNETRFNDVWSFDPRNNLWTQLDCIGFIPSPREGHAAAMVNDVMYIFGGRDSDAQDLGDLAAFRISTKRWYTFQNMGSSPSRRSGHSMTTYNGRIYVLGGEPSREIDPNDRSAVEEELGLVYILDTNKIKYPSDQSVQQQRQNPNGQNVGRPQNERITSMGPGPDGRVGQRQRSVTNDNMANRPQDGMVGGPQQRPGQQQMMNNNVSMSPGGANSGPKSGPPPYSRNGGMGPSGQPPSQPMARPNGAPLGPRSESRTNENMGGSSMRPSGPGSDRVPPAQLRIGAQPGNATPNQTGGLQERPKPRSNPADNLPSQLAIQKPTDPHKARHGSKSPDSDTESIHKPSKTVETADRATSPVETVEEPVEKSKEVEDLKRMNEWYASELVLARRAGYTIQTNNGLLDDRGVDMLMENDRPLLEAMVTLRNELVKVQSSVSEQAAQAAKKIAEVERQRDNAIGEAVYAKAKLAALSGGNNASTPTNERGDKTPDVASMDAGRFQEMSRKLSATLAAQNDLRTRLENINAELESERRARQLADETASAAQSRVSELDEFRNRAASEMESLRSQLLETERENRDVAAKSAEAVAEAQVLKLDKEELSARLKEALDNEKDLRSGLDAIQIAIVTTSDKTSVLEKQLEDTNALKDELEQQLSELKSAHEAKLFEVESVKQKLKDAEEMAHRATEEAKTSKAALLAGVKKVSERGQIDIVGSAADERVVLIQEQLQATKELLAKSQSQADDAGERLAQAMQRIAGLEYQQSQSSKEAIALRRRMAETLEELRKLKQENAESKTKLSERQLEIDTITTKYQALKTILDERSAVTSIVDKRRSQVVPSPLSGTGTPEQSARLREVEAQLEESMRTHRDFKNTAEMQAQEVEKHFREKLEQLEADYHSAVHYVRGSDKMLQRMKDELKKYKARNIELLAEVEKAQKQMTERSNSQAANNDWEQERTNLQNEIQGLRTKLRDTVAELHTQIRHFKEQLDTLREERDQYKLQTSQMQIQLLDANEEISKARSAIDKLESENSMLESRANDAEVKVSRLLDHMESSVDAYRQSTKLDTNGLSPEAASTRSSYYGADPRTSMALDSLATELDALRSHWENTNKTYRMSTSFDFEKGPASTEGDFSSSLAKWRQRLDQQDVGENGSIMSEPQSPKTPTQQSFGLKPPPPHPATTAAGVI